VLAFLSFSLPVVFILMYFLHIITSTRWKLHDHVNTIYYMNTRHILVLNYLYVYVYGKYHINMVFI